MFTSLRTRLWLTYLLLIGVVLGIIGIALITILVFNPTLDRAAFQRLDVAAVAIQRILHRSGARPGTMPAVQLREAVIRADELVDARILILHDGEILADSRADAAPPLRLQPQTETGPRGLLRDRSGQPWLYQFSQLDDGFSLLVATPRPRRVATLLSLFSDELLPPLALAAGLALLLSLLLSFLMARWIAGPLQRVADAARAVSQGQYQTLPLEGPQEVRELADSFNQMTHRVQASQKSQRDFVANVSHELKTPLTSIQGFAQAILDGTVTTPAALRQAAEVIFSEAGRMHRLVVDLLDLARLDAGTLEFTRSSIELAGLLKSVAEKLTPQAREAQVHLRTDLDQLPNIIGDGDRLAQVFTNLVDNALKYTPADGEVQIRGRQIGDRVEVSVADSGPGIPPAELPRIFERFYQLDKSRRGGSGRGVGLGLAIAHEIVEAHGGSLQARSEPGQGSVFTVVLPIVQPDDPTMVARRRR